MRHYEKLSEKVGDDFQQLTKYNRETIRKWVPVWEEQVSLYKTYPRARTIELPEPENSGGMPLWSAIAGRRTHREFSDKELSLKELSQLLWACQGITARKDGFEFRSAPSAGALYPVETYLCLNRVDGAVGGLYHYNVAAHKLELLKEGDLSRTIMQAAFMQPVFFDCAVSFIWTAMVKRSRWKYRQRAYRYIYLDAGHIAENLALAAESLGLACCLIGAFFDNEVNALLEVDGKEETAIYLSAVGYR